MLDLETKERSSEDITDIPEEKVYGNFRDGKEFNRNESGREESSHRLLEDADESDTDDLENEIADNEDIALAGDMQQIGESIAQ